MVSLFHGWKPAAGILLAAVLGGCPACKNAPSCPAAGHPGRSAPKPRAEYFTVLHPQLITDRTGNVVAIRSGKLLFQLKPGLANDLSPLMRGLDRIGISAVPQECRAGLDSDYIVLSMTIDHKTFLVR